MYLGDRKTNLLLKAHLALFFVTLIYSANYTIAKVVMDGYYVSPIALVYLRIIAACILFFISSVLIFKNFRKISRKDWLMLILCAIFGVFINQIFFLEGLNKTTPINASIILTSTPIFVIFWSIILYRIRVGLSKSIGIIFGAMGAIIILAYKRDVHIGFGLGNLLIVGNAMSFGLFLVLVKNLLAKYPATILMAWTFLLGFVFMLPIGVDDLINTSWRVIPLGIFIAIGYVMVFTTFFTYSLNTYALSRLPASTVSSYIYLQPILATVIAIVAGKDQLVLIHIVGACLIFGGVYLVSRNEKT